MVKVEGQTFNEKMTMWFDVFFLENWGIATFGELVS